jgi:hypothetical protein
MQLNITDDALVHGRVIAINNTNADIANRFTDPDKADSERYRRREYCADP